MLQLDKVRKTYSRRGEAVVALDETNLEIAVGEFVALVGPSGSGKTTLLSILGGMLAPDRGRVCLEGRSIYEMPVKERTALRSEKIGFVFQTFNLVPYLTALENVEVPLYLAGRPAREQRQRATQMLERLGLEARANHKPCELSVGQQQRVALARTLANNPDLILADEPTGNLDPENREQVLRLLKEIHIEGKTVIMVTHDPAAARLASRMLHLATGRVVGTQQAA
jgi:putative ABC transport system ATP-binding protein